eukprot:c16273_g1_i2.p1 GENE.c16273_g1_i2~~c16273_g1_i2.p1  ORF type:complete len:145 (+),score=23.62 c16273_g1_i2:327-761(+)
MGFFEHTTPCQMYDRLPKTVGTVTQSSSSAVGKDFFLLDFLYTFQANDATHQSSRIDFATNKTMTEREANDFVQAHPPGSVVDVSYDPKYPDACSIQPNAVRPALVQIGLGVFFLCPAALLYRRYMGTQLLGQAVSILTRKKPQ